MHEVQSEVPQIFQYAWLIIILPFVGVLVNLFGGKQAQREDHRLDGGDLLGAGVCRGAGRGDRAGQPAGRSAPARRECAGVYVLCRSAACASSSGCTLTNSPR